MVKIQDHGSNFCLKCGLRKMFTQTNTCKEDEYKGDAGMISLTYSDKNGLRWQTSAETGWPMRVSKWGS